MKKVFLTLLFLSVLGGSCLAIEPLAEGSYSGFCVGPVQNLLTGGRVTVVLSTNREASLTFCPVDPIDGSLDPIIFSGRVIGGRIVEGGHRFRALAQNHAQSVRGWFRLRQSGRKIIFFANYNSQTTVK